jgi:hypothetical protein
VRARTPRSRNVVDAVGKTEAPNRIAAFRNENLIGEYELRDEGVVSCPPFGCRAGPSIEYTQSTPAPAIKDARDPECALCSLGSSCPESVLRSEYERHDRYWLVNGFSGEE